MNLHEVYAALAPVVLAGGDPKDAARRLFPSARDCDDAERLAAYASCAAGKRAAFFTSFFPLTRSAVLRSHGEVEWTRLCLNYVRAHPATQPMVIRDMMQFPAYLADRVARVGDEAPPAGGPGDGGAEPVAATERAILPPWLAELADFELVAHVVRLDAAEDEADGPRGAFAFAPTLELRDYAFDLVTWVNGRAELPAGEPGAKRTLVAFLRSREGKVTRLALGRRHLEVLRALRRGGVAPERDAAVEAMLACGILVIANGA